MILTKKLKIMKKLFVFIGLMLLAGAYIAPVNASPDVNIVVAADDDKCEKCGKDNCDGKCEAKAESKKATAKKSMEKCDPACEKACCDEKKSEAAAKKGTKEKKKESKK